jgi:parallel beta-helix repeat protein
MMRSWIAALAVAAVAPAALAETISVPQDFGTIQEAVDAASSGDTILVAKGIYQEHVVVAGKDNLKFVGKKAIWDGNVDGLEGSQLRASGSGISVTGFEFRNGIVQVGIFGDGTAVSKCVSTGAEMHFVLLQGSAGRAAGARVETCTVLDSGGPAIKIHADDAVVSRCKFSRMRVIGVLVSGDDAVVERLAIRGAWVHGVVVEGQNALVQSNRIDNARVKGIQVHGGNARILSNRVTRGCGAAGIDLQHGIRTDSSDTGPFFDGGEIAGNRVALPNRNGVRSHFGTTVLITGNRVSGGGATGISCSTHSATIEGNTVTDFGLRGVMHFADDGEVRNNSVSRSGSVGEPAFYIVGDSNLFEANRVTEFGGDGFWVDGDGNTLRGNRATLCTEDGFDLEGGLGNVLEGNAASRCGAEGLDNGATDTVVDGGAFTGNLLDVVNDGTFDGFDAFFNTGGTGTPPAVDTPAGQREDDTRTRTIQGISRLVFDYRGSSSEPNFDQDLGIISQP